MDELEEYEAFAKLLKQGRNVTDIAKTFGLTERYVKQRLVLAGLNSAIKDAYRNGDIEAEELQLLATATRRQQKDWIAAFQAARMMAKARHAGMTSSGGCWDRADRDGCRLVPTRTLQG